MNGSYSIHQKVQTGGSSIIELNKPAIYNQVAKKPGNVEELLQYLGHLISEKEQQVEVLTMQLNENKNRDELLPAEAYRLQALLSNRNAQIATLFSEARELKETIKLGRIMYDDVLDKNKNSLKGAGCWKTPVTYIKPNKKT